MHKKSMPPCSLKYILDKLYVSYILLIDSELFKNRFKQNNDYSFEYFRCILFREPSVHSSFIKSGTRPVRVLVLSSMRYAILLCESGQVLDILFDAISLHRTCHNLTIKVCYRKIFLD